MATSLTWRKAIDKVLMASGEPLHYNEITERIIAEGYRASLGATPSATVNAQIARSIKHEGVASPYIRVTKGVFMLKPLEGSGQSSMAKPEVDPPIEEGEESKEVVTSFGMFWRKANVEWKSTPKLLGMQQIGATPVDFFSQVGIYLLYDGREVIYAGRTTERPLGKRLFEHTVDRMATRWDRFSWFGLLPVSEKGKLGKLPETHSASKFIIALEAVLIEALEPRQNRKRGDDLAGSEYLQMIDPELEKKRVLSSMGELLNNG